MSGQTYTRIENIRSGPPSYISRNSIEDEREDEERDRLVDAFDDSDEDEEDGYDDRDLRRREEEESSSNGSIQPSSSSSHEQYEDFETGVIVNRDIRSGSSTPVVNELPTSSASSSSSGGFLSTIWPKSQRQSSNNNDGVFANLTAKPNSTEEKPEEQDPPSYEEAAADATPPYWETTILAPGFSDELFIDGLPVGSPINFAWNMIVSSAFQFVGFFLTYLLHTSHAAKQGSRAGLGITLIQCGFYLQPEPLPGNNSNNNNKTPGNFEPSNPNDFNMAGNTPVTGSFSESPHNIPPPPPSTVIDHVKSPSSTWIPTIIMIAGTIIILKSVIDYIQARRMEIAIIRSNNDNSTETDAPPPPASPENIV